MSKRATRNEDGSALVAAVAVGFIALTLGSVVIAQAIDTNQDSGRDRQRTGQIHAAEAGVDRAYYQLQQGSTLCTVPRATLGTSPDTTVVDTTIAYYDAAGAVLPCTSGNATGTPAKALITARSTSTNTVGPGAATRARTMQSEVLLGEPAGNKGYALFSSTQVNTSGGLSVSATEGSPNVYSRTGYNCSSTGTLGGDLVVPVGAVNVSSGCTVSGDVRARDNVSMSNATVGDDVLSSAGQVSLSNSRIYGDVTSYINPAVSNSTIDGTRSTRNGSGATYPAPAEEPFPLVTYSAAAWTADGFDVQTVTNCTDINGLATRASAVTRKTVFYGNCTLNASGAANVTLPHDVAFIFTGGINSSGGFNVRSSTSATLPNRRFWMISPAPATATSTNCSSGNLNFSGTNSFDRSVQTFLYTCGTLNVSSSTDYYGQIYARQGLNTSGTFNLTWRPMPPPGASLGGAGSGYQVEVVYKRETQS